jgi:hypothetical protein
MKSEIESATLFCFILGGVITAALLHFFYYLDERRKRKQADKIAANLQAGRVYRTTTVEPVELTVTEDLPAELWNSSRLYVDTRLAAMISRKLAQQGVISYQIDVLNSVPPLDRQYYRITATVKILPAENPI